MIGDKIAVAARFAYARTGTQTAYRWSWRTVWICRLLVDVTIRWRPDQPDPLTLPKFRNHWG